LSPSHGTRLHEQSHEHCKHATDGGGRGECRRGVARGLRAAAAGCGAAAAGGRQGARGLGAGHAALDRDTGFVDGGLGCQCGVGSKGAGGICGGAVRVMLAAAGIKGGRERAAYFSLMTRFMPFWQ
jgi:hypothetical protein